MHYEVLRSTDFREIGEVVSIGPVPQTASPYTITYTDSAGNSVTGPETGIVYYYRLRAYDPTGNISQPSSAVQAYLAGGDQGADAAEVIVAAMKSRISTILGSSWSELVYAVDIGKNNKATNDYRYGVLALGATPTDTVVRSFTQSQIFEIILTRQVKRNDAGDSDLQTKVNDLHEQMNSICLDMLKSKCGAPSYVLQVSPVAISTPEYIEDEDLIIFRGDIQVQYRISY
jgi:hypothetical protein